MGLQIRAEAAGTGARSDYYEAALRFIDPQLTPDSPLADVHTAAIGRRQQLLQQPIRQSREDLQALDEALDYVRAYRLNTASAAGNPTAAEMEVLDLPAPGAASAQPDDVCESAPAAALDSHHATDPQEHTTGAVSAHRARGRASLRDVMAQAQPADAVVSAPALRTAAAPETADTAQRAISLPETRAWPLLLGVMLILWQSWLALFSGWTVVRFLIWPGPGAEFQPGWLTAAGLVVLGVAASAATGILVWRYRQRTGHLLMLVHLSAGFIALNLAAWRLAASDAQLLVDPPRGWYWLLLIGAWLVATVTAWIHDLRAGERASRPDRV
jgi:hypothetical protein